MSRVLFCLITNYMKKRVNHSGQIQARNDDTITKILYLIFTVWHLATLFLVFLSFLDSTISGHVTQMSDFVRYRKIKVTDFPEVAKFSKVPINFNKVMIIIRFYANEPRPCLNMRDKLHDVTVRFHYITNDGLLCFRSRVSPEPLRQRRELSG